MGWYSQLGINAYQSSIWVGVGLQVLPGATSHKSCGDRSIQSPEPRLEILKAKNHKTYPLVICYIAIENGHRNSGFTHWKWWFPIVMLVYQRVPHVRKSSPLGSAFLVDIFGLDDSTLKPLAEGVDPQAFFMENPQGQTFSEAGQKGSS